MEFEYNELAELFNYSWGLGMSNFDGMLELQIPRLRRYARALTRDVSRADDLVQNCLTRAVAKQHLWQHGTDLRA